MPDVITPIALSKQSRKRTRADDAVDESSETCSTPGRLSGSRRYRADKIFNCLVHDVIRMEDVCIRIIDSPEFQRLHSLKQLGVTDFVFRGATHTRFEHSLGVSHLAEEMVLLFRENQAELQISSVDVLCVKIAGLCHDLGNL